MKLAHAFALACAVIPLKACNADDLTSACDHAIKAGLHNPDAYVRQSEEYTVQPLTLASYRISQEAKMQEANLGTVAYNAWEEGFMLGLKDAKPIRYVKTIEYSVDGEHHVAECEYTSASGNPYSGDGEVTVNGNSAIVRSAMLAAGIFDRD